MASWKLKEFSFNKTAEFKQSVVIDQTLIDLNGDGKLDLLASYFWAPEQIGDIHVKVAINKGNGKFVEATNKIFDSNIPTTEHPSVVLKEDFNGDGRLDLFICDSGAETLPTFHYGLNQLILSKGQSGMENASDGLPQVREYNAGAEAGDIDHDGDMDILVVGGFTSISYFLVNDGTGHFTRTNGLLPWDNTVLNAEYGFASVVIFDANGDGWDDLFLGRAGTIAENQSLILLNDKSGTFANVDPITLPLDVPPLSYVQRAYAADFTGDGASDLLVSFTEPPDFVNAYFQILINDGLGNFANETASRLSPATAHSGGHVLLPEDINGDGHLDVMFTDARDKSPGPLFINDGTGHFVELPDSFLPTFGGNKPSRFTLADVTGDGRLDAIGSVNDEFKSTEYKVWVAVDPGRRQEGTDKSDGLLGDKSKETISGLGGKDVVFASAGNDKLLGGAGGDYLNGGDGRDKIEGDAGGDTVVGGLGKDKLTGGGGRDIFKFNTISESAVGEQHDRITDFKNDQIDLSFIDANTTIAGDQAFSFIGAETFADHIAAHPGVRGLARLSSGLLQADVDGNGVADFEVKVGPKFEAADLLL